MNRAFLLIVALLLAVGSPGNLLLATDYFVSGSGSDANDGLSLATPWRSLTFAMANTTAGDRVIVGLGTYDQAVETFPIFVRDGVEISGPGNGDAVVDSQAANRSTFQILSLSSPTIVSGLDIRAPQAGAAANVNGFRITGLPADFQVLNNTIIAQRGVSNGGVTGTGAAAGIRIEDNVIDATTGVLWRSRLSPAPHQITISGNTINTQANNGFGVQMTCRTSATLDATLFKNFIDGTQIDQGVLVQALGVNGTIDCDISENFVIGCSMGINLIASGTSGTRTLNTTANANLVTGCGIGINLAALAHSAADAVAHLGGVIQCNTVEASGIHGILGLASGSTENSSARLDPLIGFNSITGSNQDALRLSVHALTLARAECAPTVRGNLFFENGKGANFFWSEGAGGTAVLAPDLGQLAPPELGRNIFSKNGRHLDLSGVLNAAISIPAQGNWWTDSGTILEPLENVADIHLFITDRLDNPLFARALVEGYLLSELVFAPDPESASSDGGELVTLTANPRTPFLEKAGSVPTIVKLGVEKVLSFSVSPDGLELSFTMPAGFPQGSLEIEVTGPAPQELHQGMADFGVSEPTQPPPGGGGGTAPAAKAKGSSICFVATAAYGDAEAPEVRLLRRWRDECLADNPLGRALVRGYYAVSPPVAEAIAASPAARTAARVALAPVVGAVKLWLELPWLCGLAAAAGLWRLLRRRRAI